MRYPYVVILKKNSERATDLLSILLCFLSAITFLFTAIGSIGSAKSFPIGAVAIALVVGLIVNGLSKRNNRYARIRYRYLLLLAAIGWISMPFFQWICIFFLALAFLEYQTKRPLEIGFDTDRIVINSLIRQRYDWTVFNNIVLKDGLLTLDFKNNRLMQKEIADDDDDDDADEEEFNVWCRDQLAAADKRNILPLHP
jgi:hypothetical protein